MHPGGVTNGRSKPRHPATHLGELLDEVVVLQKDRTWEINTRFSIGPCAKLESSGSIERQQQ